MDAAAMFAGIAEGISGMLGGPYHPATLYRAAPYEKDDGGTIISGGPTQVDCVAQIDRVGEALRKDPGFTEAEVAVYVLASSLAGGVTSDDEIMATAGPHERHREQISSLADFYQRAFEGGAGGIWDMFRSAGTRAIAEVLAKWTIGQAGGALTKLLPSLGSFFGRPGRASGGSVPAGVLYRINESSSPGQPEGFMPQGSGKIIPLGQMNNLRSAGAAPTQVIVKVEAGEYFDARVMGVTAPHIENAAVRGAAGGSSLVQSSLARRERYRLR